MTTIELKAKERESCCLGLSSKPSDELNENIVNKYKIKGCIILLKNKNVHLSFDYNQE